MKRQIEIEDTLQECVDNAIEEVEDCLLNYLNENPDTDTLPCLHNDLDYSGRVHEIIDSAVPIYTYEIKCLWFLYGSELESAYHDSGIGNNPMENNGMVAIYCYINQQVCQWYQDEAEDVFEKWQESQTEGEE